MARVQDFSFTITGLIMITITAGAGAMGEEIGLPIAGLRLER